jgi:hypothetical protein
MVMENFWATIEYLNGHEAIITLTDSTGQWAGSGLIQCRMGGKQALYELGYIRASQSARSKGGQLDRFTVAA